jgi:hypothetical protein
LADGFEPARLDELTEAAVIDVYAGLRRIEVQAIADDSGDFSELSPCMGEYQLVEMGDGRRNEGLTLQDAQRRVLGSELPPQVPIVMAFLLCDGAGEVP